MRRGVGNRFVGLLERERRDPFVAQIENAARDEVYQLFVRSSRAHQLSPHGYRVPHQPRVGKREIVPAKHADAWLTKLTLVAADCGLTTVPPELSRHLPVGVTLLRVEDGPPERRRLMVARLAGKPVAPVAAVIAALRAQNSRDRA